ncbi:DUF309 domain-containing protein [Paenibacillus sp. WQ 127069]|uniref:DUF309 domain-containing protein n=1 Tax=Paenibacillus baimaensis TaxID=2982185 RepID=A0ABT2UTX8_9BACL|nr:DUF309 domain-containing protein [Paenibacillus sp. WQ 127069]MCU6798108.1 DUF309 domain-containing protein [Paenibacillus sp. WQ 127069]
MQKYPQAYINYLIYFHAERDYFECHEVLEEYWKDHPGDLWASTYVGLIQVAVSLYHWRRHNYAGAEKMLRSALTQLKDTDLVQLGIEAKVFRTRLSGRLEALENPDDRQYEDLDIPLADPQLEVLCLEHCSVNELTWLSPSDLNNTQLIHKHTLRDRAPVILERERSRQLKLLAKRDKG